MKAAVIILNYNMPEATDEWVRTIRERVTYPHDLIVVDNGSDKVMPSRHTTVRVDENVRTTGGLRIGIEYADMLGLKNGKRPKFYWVISTSTALSYSREDPLKTLIKGLVSKGGVAIAPAFVGYLEAWTHIMYAWNNKDESITQIPTVPFGVISSDWYHSVGGYEQRLTHSWGLEHDLAFKLQDNTSWLHHGVRLLVKENIGYKMGRMDLSVKTRRELAGREMNEVLTEKYGQRWIKVRDAEGYDRRE